MPEINTPYELNGVELQKQYTLDVRLFTYSAANLDLNLEPKEFTGFDTYGVGYFKNNIGFGITDINISVNTSLQPIVEITFKDLYGNTVFSKNQENVSNGIYKDIFDWPPPKFDLVYKGYLGKPTRLMLNLKKTDIQYNSSDGSFTIKCSFVPNIWGPFADIPTLFLHAVKKLKINEGQKDVVTFFDLLKIGKQVDAVRKSYTNQFDDLKNKLNQVRSSLYVAYTNNIVSPGDALRGVVPSKGGVIQGFKNITLYDFKSDSNGNINDLKKLKNNDAGIDPQIISDYFLCKTKIDGTENYTGTIANFKSAIEISRLTEQERDAASQSQLFAPLNIVTSPSSTAQQESDKIKNILNSKIKAIDDNITLINDTINKLSYEETTKELEQITISQLFSKLAGDTGYLLGKILKSGILGYNNNKASRESDSKRLIGRYFPLQIKKKGEGESPELENVQGIADEKKYFNNSIHELDFIREFIDCIAFGLADAASLEETLDTKGRKQLIRRISNLEALQPNPYFPTRESIIENMVVRSGIWAYFTMSPEPNRPGDYANEVLKLELLTVNKEDEVKSAKQELENITESIIKEIPIEELTDLKNSLRYFKKAFNPENSFFANLGVDADTKFEIETGVFYNFKDATNKVDFSKVGIPQNFGETKYLFNNNLFWENSTVSKDYKFVLFTSRQDVEFLRTVNSSITDSKYNGTDEQNTDEDPPGIVIIDSFIEDSENPAKNKITFLNEIITDKQVISYDSIINKKDEYLSSGFKINNIESQLFTTTIDQDYGGFPIAYSIYSANDYTADDKTAWNLFGSGDGADLQRKFLYNLANELLIKIESIEQERNIFVADVKGKASELAESIYTQMHHIFFQWASLVFDYTTDNISNNQQQKFVTNELPARLEQLYNGVSIEGGNERSGFQYLAPLIKKSDGTAIDVENSILNLESCYRINSNSTVLNVIQNICNQNNFLFFPLPGGNYDDIEGLFTPQPVMSIPSPGNRFIILWAPTPESRARDNDDQDLGFIQNKQDIKPNFFSVKFGSVDNAVFKNVRVGTDSTKTTAESIVNLQRLVDKQVDNQQVTKDCSTIPVIEGRSYTSEIDTLGNAQIYPMQFFYIDNMPIFGGLYQIMEVSHNITPNNFETKFKGMKMRYSGGFGGIPPVTIQTLKSLSERIIITSTQPGDYTENNVPDYSDVKDIGNNPPVESSDSFDTKSVTALKQLYKNGELPDSALVESSVMRALYVGKDKRDIKYKLFKDASSSLNAFINYFNKSKFAGKQPLSITDGYRDLREQIILKDRLGTQAAKPGTSNHGWGVAVDFWWGVPTNFRKNDELRKIAFNHPMYKWFFENAWRFGWYNPAGLRDNSGLDEWWHWEYFGNQGQPGNLPSVYAQSFDFVKFPEKIKSNGGFFKA